MLYLLHKCLQQFITNSNLLLKCGIIVQWLSSCKGSNIFNILVSFYSKRSISMSQSKECPFIKFSDFYLNNSFITQQQNSKACRYADLQHFDSVCFQCVQVLLLWAGGTREARKKGPVAYKKQLSSKGLC